MVFLLTVRNPVSAAAPQGELYEARLRAPSKEALLRFIHEACKAVERELEPRPLDRPLEGEQGKYWTKEVDKGARVGLDLAQALVDQGVKCRRPRCWNRADGGDGYDGLCPHHADKEFGD